MRSRIAVLGLALSAAPIWAQGPTPSLNILNYQARAATIFDPATLSAAGSPLSNACDQLLLACQALAGLIVVAAMISRLRRDRHQMEGVAALIIKVAFIATVGVWQAGVLSSVNSVATWIGYEPAAANGSSSQLVGQMWTLAGQWMPPRSPQMDALDDQSPTNGLVPGHEDDWLAQSWNWARGVTADSESEFHNLWHASANSLRAFFVLLGCAAVSCSVLLAIALSYFGGVAQVFLFSAGCALLPIFLAGLGVDALKGQSSRYILGLVAIAFWPVGWALVDIITSAVLQGVVTWQTSLVTTALAVPAGTVAPTLAVAAPSLAWGVLFLFGVLTLAVCLWSILGLIFVPMMMVKIVSSGAQTIGGLIGSAFVTSSSPVAGSFPLQGVANDRVRRSSVAGATRGAAVPFFGRSESDSVGAGTGSTASIRIPAGRALGTTSMNHLPASLGSRGPSSGAIAIAPTVEISDAPRQEARGAWLPPPKSRGAERGAGE